MKVVNKKHNLPYFFSILLLLLMGVIQSCSFRSFFGTKRNDRGEFKTGARSSWQMEAPAGMVLIPGGSFMMGEVSADIVNKANPNKRTTVSPFFMDETETTNVVYRKFLEILFDKLDTPVDANSSTNTVLDEDTNNGTRANKHLNKNVFEGLTEDFIMTKLYPDSNVWRNDFTNHMADILLEGYYEHPAYDEYPVVGITWEAAKYFAAAHTNYFNEYREGKGLPPYPSFSLPSAAQWEYAARGGKELAKYPWGGPYIRDHEGNLRANFKSDRGNYNEGGYTYTSPVTAFPPNEYNLYDMAGNVSEWTLDSYNPAIFSRTWDLDPLYINEEEPLKIIKGGSWKDISRFLQTGSIDYERKDKARSYIGFRCVIPYIGGNSN